MNSFRPDGRFSNIERIFSEKFPLQKVIKKNLDQTLARSGEFASNHLSSLKFLFDKRASSDSVSRTLSGIRLQTRSMRLPNSTVYNVN